MAVGSPSIIRVPPAPPTREQLDEEKRWLEQDRQDARRTFLDFKRSDMSMPLGRPIVAIRGALKEWTLWRNCATLARRCPNSMHLRHQRQQQLADIAAAEEQARRTEAEQNQQKQMLAGLGMVWVKAGQHELPVSLVTALHLMKHGDATLLERPSGEPPAVPGLSAQEQIVPIVPSVAKKLTRQDWNRQQAEAELDAWLARKEYTYVPPPDDCED